MKANWRYTMLAAWAAAALSLSALASFAEPERGDKGPSAKVDVDRNSGSRKSYGDRGKEGAGKTHEDREGGDPSVHGAALIMKSKRAAIAVGKVLCGTATVFGVGADMGGVRAYPSISAMGITTAIAAGLRGARIVTRSPIWWQRYHRCRDFD